MVLPFVFMVCGEQLLRKVVVCVIVAILTSIITVHALNAACRAQASRFLCAVVLSSPVERWAHTFGSATGNTRPSRQTHSVQEHVNRR